MENKVLEFDKIFKVIFETAAEGLIVVDASGIMVMANPKSKLMFGYTGEELIGEPVEILIPKDKHKAHTSHRHGFMKRPQARPMGLGLSLSAIHKSGKEFPVEVSLNHFDLEGQPMVMCFLTDITERKEAEDSLKKLNAELEQRVAARTLQLAESQMLYSLIAKNYPNGTINVFDRNLNYVFVDGAELHKNGIDSSTIIGSSYLSRLPEEIRDTISNQLLEVFENGDTSFEIESRGEVFTLACVGLSRENGVCNQILVVEQNITSQKRAEKRTQEALHQEKELNELKSRFVSMASHEFRTPLSAILSSVSLIDRYDGVEAADKRAKHISRIKRSVQNLTTILNDFLSLDKLEAGKVLPAKTEFNFREFAMEVCEEVNMIKKSGQVIHYQHRGADHVVSDQHVLKNILTNLLSNAIKYSGEGKTISLIANIREDALLVDVVDQGIGIPEEDQIHLFERFFRAKNSLNIQGTGLGLNITRKFANLMGGEITFESVVDKGSKFSLVLPLSPGQD